MLPALLCCFLSVPSGPFGVAGVDAVAHAGDASSLEILAARELRRYFYLRTGELVPVREISGALPLDWSGVLVARKDRRVLRRVLRGSALEARVRALKSEEYVLETVNAAGARVLLAVGGDEFGTLYAAYRLAEHLGVRFHLHGDVIPDGRVALSLPDLHEHASPLFRRRGIQPFHDFPEGPDWWNLDDYKAIFSQLPKLRMNFFGLHTYPEGHPNAEPTVWIGLPEEIGEGTRVRASYPSSWQNTRRGNWGYAARNTGDYHFGASALFERDDYGCDAMLDLCPRPDTPEDCNLLFSRAGALLREAFAHARELGIRTCVGTETPLTVPKRVRERLEAAGKDPEDPEVIGELYEGLFLRAARCYSPDYYWFWTPEGWTWQGASGDQVQRTMRDLEIAIEAWKRARVPFQLATCGWVLGPQGNRSLFDEFLPAGVTVSCINRQVGKEFVDPAFTNVKKRSKWAIPWLEDDPNLTGPQLWVGRMRRDAADARRYGCTGLIGIHWRTRILAPNVLALARAAWSQEPWDDALESADKDVRGTGPVGGKTASFPSNAIDNTDDDPLYQTVRYDMKAYRIELSEGKYDVTLKFCEPHHDAAGKRVFGVKLEGKQVVEKLDIFARVGKNKAFDLTFKEVEVSDGRLDIEFDPQVEFPSIAAITVLGSDCSIMWNCGGGAYRDWAADPEPAPPPARYLPTRDFYEDWAASQFGHPVGPAVAELFSRLDGALPIPSDWVKGPGGLKPDARPWSQVSKEYAFVDELAAFRERVVGTGNLDRFDWWLATFRYMRSIGQVRCLWSRYQKAMEKVRAEGDPETKKRLAREVALPLLEEMVEVTGEVYARLLETVSNPGEMGTVANWEQHILPSLLEKPAEELERVLGEPLPASARPGTDYAGRARVIVPTVRASVEEGEVLRLKAMVLAKNPPRAVAVFWRPLGKGEYKRVPLLPVARGVYRAAFPEGGADGQGLEYHVRAELMDGTEVRFPATAPDRNQTVVVAPPREREF